MVIHALGSDFGSYLRGEEASPVVFEKYLPAVVIIAAFMITALIVAGTGGRRSD